MKLSTPVSNIAKIGPVYAKRLKKMGIQTTGDLLFHFPVRYIDFSQIKKIADLKINEPACIKGTVEDIKNEISYRRRLSITKAVIKDDSSIIGATWFNQPYLVNSLRKGDKVFLTGKITISKQGAHLSNPTYEKISTFEDQEIGPTHMARLVPIYQETRGLTSRWLRYIIKPLLFSLKDRLPETLPKEIIKENKLLGLNEALYQIHFPDDLKIAEQAKERFAFEELFFLELFILSKKQELQELNSIAIPLNLEKIQDFVKSLDFTLSKSQKKVSWQILKDLEKKRPMSRLLQGDVGSGKTIVAAIASLNTIKAGYQVAFMAPTEILSKQHFKTLADFFKGFRVDIGLLTSKTDKYVSKKLNQPIEISRKKLLENTLNGKINILVGTHSLIQDKVKFDNLAFVVLDEQHRFGVKQRAKLCKKHSTIPHLLSMTATPIPRSLALTIYGDLDLSLIDEMPQGERRITTKVITDKERDSAYELVKMEIKKGKQAFIICPRIEESEKKGNDKTGWANVKSVKQEFEYLSKKIFPKLRLAMLHGKIPTLEKSKIMKDFQRGKIDVLISTSVVEVGIDIPNATIMLIESADRFGLAQLHQFRGRIGRKGDKSYCLLFHSKGTSAPKRLRSLAKIDNGLELAEIDLKLRGPGQFLGTKQWGLPDIAMDALNDFSLVEKTRQTAKEILELDPKLKKHPLLKKRVKKFQEKIHLE